MNRPVVGILEPDAFSAKARAALESAGFEVRTFSSAHPLAAFLHEVDALFIRLGRFIDGDLLRLAPRLRWLISPTTGVTHIDTDAASARGVTVLTLAGNTHLIEHITSTPEHALGLTLALLRNYGRAFVTAENLHWDRDSVRGHMLAGQCVGLIGHGRVGRRLAQTFSALGCRVSLHDPTQITDGPDARRLPDADAVIASSDIVILAASYAPGDPVILDAARLDALAGKFLVNIARGELIDEAALIERLERDLFAGVALDVIQNENAPANNLPRLAALTQNRNLLLTPHVGGATWQAMALTEEIMADMFVAAWQAAT
ncbi:hydroxyacid dehydrogenase [Alsobacter metallidurans]|uniref:Hydroxyacid dehydrogenase n=1 Tax=Alsobacter metallidurans TaxID=340221 RepID=A0A917I662_9HYPH|nr:NAD(P)-dependent oxidoreductase [Alsobacter metallidurans]GGH15516.1 hydroxyacid dehydrogenase [Alsobacter metallidurans]